MLSRSEQQNYGRVAEGVPSVAPLRPAVSSFWDLHAYACVRSTNELVKEALRQGVPEGYCATALRQEGGYGRQGRVWASPLGGVYTSFALRPNVPPHVLPTLSLVASLAVADALEQVRPSCNLLIKWPNDVLCPQGKLAGISLEALAGGVCVGVGVNVYEPFAKREVEGKYSLAYLQDGVAEASLSAEQRAVMTKLLESMLETMERRYGRWIQEGFAAFIDEYSQRFAYRNKRASLALINGDETIEGIIRGVDDLGRLLVENDVGVVVPMSSGEVHLTSF